LANLVFALLPTDLGESQRRDFADARVTARDDGCFSVETSRALSLPVRQPHFLHMQTRKAVHIIPL